MGNSLSINFSQYCAVQDRHRVHVGKGFSEMTCVSFSSNQIRTAGVVFAPEASHSRLTSSSPSVQYSSGRKNGRGRARFEGKRCNRWKSSLLYSFCFQLKGIDDDRKGKKRSSADLE